MIDKTYQCLFCLVLLFGIPQKQTLAQEIAPVSLRWLTTEGPATAVRCLAGGREVAAGSVTQGWTEILQIWDAEQRRVVHGSKEGNSEIDSISIDAHGTTLAAIEMSSSVFVWDLRGWKRLKSPPIDRTDFVHLACLQTTGERLAVVTRAHGLRLWDVAAGKWVDLCRGQPSEIFGIDFAEKLLVGTVTGEIWEYHEERWQRMCAAPYHRSTVISQHMVEMADRQRLFVLDDDGIVRWLADGQVEGQIFPNSGPTRPAFMAVHPSGERLVTVTGQGLARFWKVSTDSAECLAVLDCHRGLQPDPNNRINALSIDDASGLIAVASSAGGVRLFRSDWWRGGP